MRTAITSKNPHGYGRYGFAWENVRIGAGAHLDFGCSDGRFLDTLRSKRIARLVGVDISPDAIRRARERFPDLEFRCLSRTLPLPFADGAFDSITMLDVLEHVYQQAPLLRELRRILKDDGSLILTVPGQHFFSFLDLGNLKFVFPRLHRWYYVRNHSQEEYQRRYCGNPEGLVGDVSSKKRWHEHFCGAKMRDLFERSGFETVKFDGSGFIIRLIEAANLFLRSFSWLQPFIRRIQNYDQKRFESANLFCVAGKKHER